MKKLAVTTYFPLIAISLGGAESIERLTRIARVKLPGQDLVSIPIKELPTENEQTAFNIADAVKRYQEKKIRKEWEEFDKKSI